MNAETFTASFDGAAQHLGGLQASYRSPEWQEFIRLRPVGRVLGNFKMRPLLLDLIWFLPAGTDPGVLPERELGIVVASLRQGGAVAIHATHVDAIAAVERAAKALLGVAQD